MCKLLSLCFNNFLIKHTPSFTMNDSFIMDDNFDELTGRYNSSISIPVQEAPGRRPAMGSLENSVPAFDGNSTLWSQVGIMNSWINTAQSKFTHFEKLVETQSGVIDTVKKENALLKQEVKELKEHVEKRTKKKTCSPREKLLSVILIFF